MAREQFLEGHEQIFYKHSCITFALFEFRFGVIVGCYFG